MIGLKMKKLLLNYLLPKMQFHVGDLVTSAEGDTVYEVSAIFYTEKLVPAMLIRDGQSNVYTVMQLGHKVYGGSVNL